MKARSGTDRLAAAMAKSVAAAAVVDGRMMGGIMFMVMMIFLCGRGARRERGGLVMGSHSNGQTKDSQY